MRSNKISALEGLGGLPKLGVLALDDNPLTALLLLRPVSVLSKLQTLSLQDTPIAQKLSGAQLRVLLRNLVPGKFTAWSLQWLSFAQHASLHSRMCSLIDTERKLRQRERSRCLTT